MPVICGLSRTKTADLDCAWDAVKGAARPRVHTFIATSQVHMEFKLRMSEDEVAAAAVAAVSHLVSRGCVDIEFSPEDAGRSERPFLYRILSEVIVAGATTLNIPDTTGWNLPHEFGSLIADLRANVAGAEGVVFSTHCQNDLGLSTANSLAGARWLPVHRLRPCHVSREVNAEGNPFTIQKCRWRRPAEQSSVAGCACVQL